MNPKRRFNGFSGAWISCKLGNISTINPKSSSPIPSIFTYIDLASVEKGILVSKKQIQKANAPSRAQRLLQNNDILFQTVRPYQQNNFFFNLGSNYVASTGYAQIRTNMVPRFLYQALHTNHFLNDVMVKCTGTSYPTINSNHLASIDVSISLNLAEQQKIADFLSLVDVKIEKLGTKIELLKTYKKGMMQKIFSQKFRFKQANGNPFPAWTNTTLGNVSTITMGQSPQSSNYNNAQIGLPLIQGNADCINRKTNPKVYTSQITKTCNIGDIIMTVRAPVGNIAKSMHIACIGRGVCSINHNSHMICSDYLYQFLLYSESNWQVLAQGSTFTSINSKQIYNFPIQLPSLPEQQKIATLLSSLDQQIDLLTQQHTLLIQQKKSYLSALL